MASDTKPLDKRTGILPDVADTNRGGPTTPLSPLDLGEILNAGNPGFKELTEEEISDALTVLPDGDIFKGLSHREVDASIEDALKPATVGHPKPRISVLLDKSVRDSLAAQGIVIFLVTNYPDLAENKEGLRLIATGIAEALSNEKLCTRMGQEEPNVTAMTARNNAARIANGIVEGWLTRLELDGQSLFTSQEKIKLEESKTEIACILLRAYDTVLGARRRENGNSR